MPRATYGQNADGTGHAECAEYRNTPLPTEAALIPVQKDWPNCASYKLYSGIGTSVDLEAARRCAWSERLAAQAGLAPKYTLESIFGGSAMLTVLYANGEGVERSIPLALRFACEADFDSDFDDIESLDQEAHGKRPKFVLCNEAKTEFSIGFCAGYQQQIDDQERKNAYRKISSQWPAAHRAAFEKLLVTEANYAKAHAMGETDLSGSGRTVWEINSEESIENDFLSAIKIFETGKAIPKSSSADAATSEANINRLLEGTLAMAEAKKSGYGAIQPEGIRKAEQAWLSYRTAWTEFSKLHYPSVSTEAWVTLLTKDRIDILKDVQCYAGVSDEPCDPDGPEEDGHTPRPLP